MTPLGRRVLLLCLLAGSALRVLLVSVNPPTNAFDDHFRPITLLLETGRLPAASDCWECYHPPVFYVVSAGIARLASFAGVAAVGVQKIVHFMPCLYGILTLVLLASILRRLRLPTLPTCVAFATACFLPRHVYMSAMHSNDTIAYLGVTLCVALNLAAFDDGLRPRRLVLLALALAATVLTKYTSLVALPMVLAPFAAAWAWRLAPGRRRIAIAGVGVALPALVALLLFTLPNVREYGRPFPSNLELFHDEWLASGRAARDIDWWGFHPLQAIGTPILAPGQRDSLWTVLWASSFFDTEPRFLRFTDPADPAWWEAYDRYLGGADDAAWPGVEALSRATRLTGSLLLTLGLLPLLLLLLGALDAVLGRWRMLFPVDRPAAVRMVMLPLLALGIAAGIVLTTWKFPYTFSMKSTYVLNALPACVVFVALGAERIASRAWGRQLLLLGTTLLGITCTWHVLTLFAALLAT